MLHVRDILNQMKWHEGFNIKDIEIEYRDRIESRSITLSGSEIEDWDKSFIYTNKGGAIPFHRVEMITHKGEIIYQHTKNS